MILRGTVMLWMLYKYDDAAPARRLTSVQRARGVVLARGVSAGRAEMRKYV
ncbi:hypothetical protein HMPREF9237_00630 [Actinotignum schaalii FB123-CNA-2]|uniref:Uncharacterized protein n=1 Tax=Actinotignum schaalii FB123-CNA-2 TaxID=883067 RepID=S2W3W7_9ACTO|nr:hypothetical protein HMPREF9237_00630 [Actinotignum schaalii FB123-CNA-2]